MNAQITVIERSNEDRTHFSDGESSDHSSGSPVIRQMLSSSEVELLIKRIKNSSQADLFTASQGSKEKFTSLTGCNDPQSYLANLELAITSQRFEKFTADQIFALTREQWLVLSLLLGSFYNYIESHCGPMNSQQRKMALKTLEFIDDLMKKISKKVRDVPKRTLN